MEDTNETQFKQYKNDKLLSLVQSLIPNDKYGEFTPLIHEIVMRRSYTFNLTEEQITHDIENLLNNCKTIQFSNNFKKNSTLGRITLSKKLLEINDGAFSKNTDYEKMYETLTHEVYHAMSAKRTTNNKIYTGLQFFDEKGNKSGTPLNEVFNEAAADLASYSRTSNDESNYFHKTKAYPNITFVVPLLAASLGVTEKEMIKAGISSRDELIEFMSSKIPENEREDFLFSFEKFEFQLDSLKKFTDMTKAELTEDDKRNIENAYTEIGNFSFNTLYASLINDNRPLTKEVQEEFEYRRDAVSEIISNAHKNFSSKMLDGASNRISKNINITSRLRTNSLIVGLNHISRISNQITDEEQQLLISNMKLNYPQKKYGSFMKYEKNLVGEKGITPFDSTKNTVTSVRYSRDIAENTYRQRIREENHDGFRKWDNTTVMEQLKSLYEAWKERNTPIFQTESTLEEPRISVTPKQIATCAQLEEITSEEVTDVESIFTNMIMQSQNRGNQGIDERD